jgi:5-methylcytosine-specific restriction endonuclease McrA
MDSCFFCLLWGKAGLLTPAGDEGRTIQARWVLVHHDADIERFYTSRQWRACRASVLKERGGLCELCLAKGLIEPAVHVHHKEPLTPENLKNPEIATNKANLLCLCEACHAEQHRRKRWRCDPMGHVNL